MSITKFLYDHQQCKIRRKWTNLGDLSHLSSDFKRSSSPPVEAESSQSKTHKLLDEHKNLRPRDYIPNCIRNEVVATIGKLLFNERAEVRKEIISSQEIIL